MGPKQIAFWFLMMAAIYFGYVKLADHLL